ncbi:hypothetical protein ABIB82_003206 [Bradyrhizobium sp. i1.8.4]
MFAENESESKNQREAILNNRFADAFYRTVERKRNPAISPRRRATVSPSSVAPCADASGHLPCAPSEPPVVELKPKCLRDRSVRMPAMTDCRQIFRAARKIRSGDADQSAIPDFILDQPRRQMAPGETMKDQLLLHRMVRHATLMGTLDQEEAFRRRLPRRVADDALREGAHPLRRDLTRPREWQKPGSDDRHHCRGCEFDLFEARIRRVGVMKHEVGLARAQALKRPPDSLIFQLQARPWIPGKEPGEHLQDGRPWAQVADDDTQHDLVSADKLVGIALQQIELAQRQLRTLVKRPTGVRQPNAVSAAIEQRKA